MDLYSNSIPIRDALRAFPNLQEIVLAEKLERQDGWMGISRERLTYLCSLPTPSFRIVRLVEDLESGRELMANWKLPEHDKSMLRFHNDAKWE